MQVRHRSARESLLLSPVGRPLLPGEVLQHRQYNISRQLVRRREHAALLPHVDAMKRLNKFGHKRAPVQSGLPPGGRVSGRAAIAAVARRFFLPVLALDVIGRGSRTA
jgi:hypothetical protein